MYVYGVFLREMGGMIGINMAFSSNQQLCITEE